MRLALEIQAAMLATQHEMVELTRGRVSGNSAQLDRDKHRWCELSTRSSQLAALWTEAAAAALPAGERSWIDRATESRREMAARW